MKTIKYYLISLMLLVVHSIVAQPDTLLLPSTTHVGAGWGSNGGYTTFGMAGQYAQGNLAGGDYTGKIGYILGNLEEPVVNEPPVAISPSVQFYYEVGSVLTLEGYDPEDAPIEFEITRDSDYGTLSLADGMTTSELLLTPNLGLLPDVIYEDTIEFQVNEVNTSQTSNIATVAFKFFLEDTPHEVTGLSKSSNTFGVTFADTVFNASYGVDVNYYNISDPLNSQLVNVQNGPVVSESLDIGALSASYSFDVDQGSHSYLFTEDQVLVTVLVTSPNGYSSFNTFIIDNAAGGRVLASEDGDYFVVGSDMSVPENKSVAVKLVAVDFAGFDSEPTVEWTKNPGRGILSSLTLIESSNNIRIWETTYTATEEVGGSDDFSFRVFNPIRNSYESGDVTMEIQEVNDIPELAIIPDQQWEEDADKLVTLNYSDPDNSLSVMTESNNPQITASIVDGNLSLSSDPGYSGTALVSVWVEEVGTDEEYLVLKQLDVEVTPVNDSPVLTSIANQSDDEDVTISVALEATDADGDVLIFDYYGSIIDPTLATIQFSGNTINIVPRANANGTTSVTVVADDGSGADNALSNTVMFDVTFNAVNDEPEVVQELVDQVLLESFSAYDVDMTNYFVDAESAATDLVLSDNATIVSISYDASNLATITYVGPAGQEAVTFTATDSDDGGLEASFDVVFTINPLGADLNVASEITLSAFDEDFGEHIIDISGVFEDTNDGGAIFTYDLLGATLVSASINGDMLTLSSIDDAFGSEQLILVGTTNGESIIEPFDITINSVNDAPVISVISNQTMKEDGTLEDLLVEVVDPEGDAITLFDATSDDQTLITDANITHSNSGNFYFVDFTSEANESGSATITVSADDGMEQTQTMFTLNVSSVNDFPTVSGSLSDLNQDGSFNVDMTTLFDDIDSEGLTYLVESKPDWMSQSGNDLTGTPTNDDVGIDQLTILASDQGGFIRATFEFEILNVNDAPTRIQEAGSRSIYTGEAFSYDFPEGNFKDIDVGDDLTYTIESKPSWLIESDGTLSGTPTSENVGDFEVVYRATDGSGLFVEDQLSLNVSILTYNVTISFTKTSGCEGSTSSVSASGAFNYNWYNAEDELVFTGGTYESTMAAILFVEGVDGQGIVTQSKSETSVDFNPLPDATLTQEGNVLEAPVVEGYGYSWLLGSETIPGADMATYEASESGSYQVIVVSDLGCTSTSSVLEVTIIAPEPEEEVLGLDDPSEELIIFPVPARDHLTIKWPKALKDGRLSVVNLQGREVFFANDLFGNEVNLDLQSYPKGVYFVRMQIESTQFNLKFIKE